MGMEKEPDEITSDEKACELARTEFIAAIRMGVFTWMDGWMSPISLALSTRLGSMEFDMNSWWVETPQNYTCPACGREKIDIARLNTSKEIMCHLVEHHDHMKDVLKRRFQEISVQRTFVVADEHTERFAKRSATMISAYENTLICEDCNNADAIAKKVAGAHRDFSFSPQEILRITKPAPNKAHEIDVNAAKNIWAEQKATFELRMKIADRIAEIAANNEHWFQHGDFNCSPNVINQRASAFIAHKGAYGIHALLKGPQKIKPARSTSAWRKITHYPPQPAPTSNEIEHAGQVGRSKAWNMVDENWRCPGCQRNKRNIVRQNKDKQWMFSVTTHSYFDSKTRWSREENVVCGDCLETAKNLGKEAATRAGVTDPIGYSAQVSMQEIQRCIIPNAYTRHNINNDEAEQIIDAITHKILQRYT